MENQDNRYKALFNSVDDGLSAHDPISLAFLEINDGFARQFGYSREAALSMTFLDIIAKEESEKARVAFHFAAGSNETTSFSIDIRAASGTRVPAEAFCRKSSLDGRDVVTLHVRPLTDQKMLERREQARNVEILESARLSALSEMAAALAHELNQPLQVLKMSLDAIGLELDGVPDTATAVKPTLEEMRKQIDRASAVLRDLRTFAREDAHTPEESADLEKTVNTALGFFEEQLRFLKVRLTREFAPNLPRAKVNPIKYQRVVSVLLSNARAALLSKAREQGESFEPNIIARLYAEPDRDAITLEIEDNGEGMCLEVSCRCLEPFYTTRPVGEGMGLGLSIAYGVIQEFRGKIEIETKEDEGCLVRVRAPIAH